MFWGKNFYPSETTIPGYQRMFLMREDHFSINKSTVTRIRKKCENMPDSIAIIGKIAGDFDDMGYPENQKNFLISNSKAKYIFQNF